MTAATDYIFHFFGEGSGASGTDSPEFHNHNCTDLTLEVKGGAGGFPFTVKGLVDLDGEARWSDLAIIDLKDFSVLDKIEKDGLYAIGVGGIQRIKVVAYAQSQATVTGKFGG